MASAPPIEAVFKKILMHLKAVSTQMSSIAAEARKHLNEEIGSLLFQLTEPSQELHNVALIIANLIIQNKNRLLMVTNQQ
jgi:hypothetical protein